MPQKLKYIFKIHLEVNFSKCKSLIKVYLKGKPDTIFSVKAFYFTKQFLWGKIHFVRIWEFQLNAKYVRENI